MQNSNCGSSLVVSRSADLVYRALREAIVGPTVRSADAELKLGATFKPVS